MGNIVLFWIHVKTTAGYFLVDSWQFIHGYGEDVGVAVKAFDQGILDLLRDVCPYFDFCQGW
jgi:hypothetical protein